VIELRISEAAAISIVEQADYYRQAADLALALRWDAAVDDAIHSLLVFPERGAPCRFHSAALAGLRWVFIPGFPKHMVFYKYMGERQILSIVQVLHGARNLEIVLDEGA
jgi:plasmid stabilization system protein ParE